MNKVLVSLANPITNLLFLKKINQNLEEDNGVNKNYC